MSGGSARSSAPPGPIRSRPCTASATRRPVTEPSATKAPRGWARIRRLVGRIGVRLLIVNFLALLVPVAGIEFARLLERQLLASLERGMKDQSVPTRALIEDDLARGVALSDPRHASILTEAARQTRTRIRLLDEQGHAVIDSHENGPPEGPEPPPPRMLPRSRESYNTATPMRDLKRDPSDPNAWPELEDRPEVRSALAGQEAARTRIRARAPGVFLFIAEPIRKDGAVKGAVYVVRSTRPVLVELYRIRSGLVRVLGVAFFLTALVTMLLALSISR